MTNMTAREEYWVNLHYIADVTGELNRRMSFKEADDWCTTYDIESAEGYPQDAVIQRAWDYMFYSRKGFQI